VDLLARDAIEACYPGLRYLRRRYGIEGAPPGPGDSCWPEQSAELRRAKAAISRSFRRLEVRQ
jgi:hypothetical protein